MHVVAVVSVFARCAGHRPHVGLSQVDLLGRGTVLCYLLTATPFEGRENLTNLQLNPMNPVLEGIRVGSDDSADWCVLKLVPSIPHFGGCEHGFALCRWTFPWKMRDRTDRMVPRKRIWRGSLKRTKDMQPRTSRKQWVCVGTTVLLRCVTWVNALKCENQSGDAEPMPMLASELDVQLFTSVVTNPSAKKYLEFGCGGSTEIVAKKTKMSIVSVDSSTAWLCKVERRVRYLGHQERFTAVYVNIGKLKALGHPADKEFVHAWPVYCGVSKNHTDADVVFVDGRFRVACILQTILFAKKNPTIAVHDFWRRPMYHEVLPFLHVVNKGNTLMTATIKPDFDRRACQKVLAKYLLKPSRI